MTQAADSPKPISGMEAFELASLRNSPLSVIRPGELGKSPMARGRFLAPADGAVIVENLQIPGRDVAIKVDQAIEAYFQHDGQIFQFRSRVLEMDTPVRLNDAMVVKGMKIAAPKSIERGNRRTIYRQSFASVKPPVDVSVWAVPLSMLTPEQAYLRQQRLESEAAAAHKAVSPDATGAPSDGAAGEIEGFRIERAERIARGLSPADTLFDPVRGLTLDQIRPLLKTPSHWDGEVADASEFGLGITVQNVVYSRLKMFQPLAVRFTLPGMTDAMEVLLEIRRVQGLNDTDARVGGLLLINAASHAEVRCARELARFTLELQRERAKRVREAA